MVWGTSSRPPKIGRQAWKIHSQVRGETHPGSLTILHNLAGSLRQAGDLDEAVQIYDQLHDQLNKRCLKII